MFLQPLANRLQVHRVVAKRFYNLRGLISRHASDNFHRANIHAAALGFTLTHPGERMRFFNAFRALAFFFISIDSFVEKDFWQARSLGGLAFSSGSLGLYKKIDLRAASI